MSEEEIIQIEVTEEQAESFVDQLENELERIENTLNSFRSNNLTDTVAYRELQTEKEVTENKINDIQNQIDEQTLDGLESLFA